MQSTHYKDSCMVKCYPLLEAKLIELDDSVLFDGVFEMSSGQPIFFGCDLGEFGREGFLKIKNHWSLENLKTKSRYQKTDISSLSTMDLLQILHERIKAEIPEVKKKPTASVFDINKYIIQDPAEDNLLAI